MSVENTIAKSSLQTISQNRSVKQFKSYIKAEQKLDDPNFHTNTSLFRLPHSSSHATNCSRLAKLYYFEQVTVYNPLTIPEGTDQE